MRELQRFAASFTLLFLALFVMMATKALVFFSKGNIFGTVIGAAFAAIGLYGVVLFGRVLWRLSNRPGAHAQLEADRTGDRREEQPGLPAETGGTGDRPRDQRGDQE